MKSKFFSIFILFLISVSSCRKENKQDQPYLSNQNCIELNDSAYKIISACNFGKANSECYSEALRLLDKAIQCDSNYHIPYYNKMSVHLRLKQYGMALQNFEKYTASIDNPDPEIIAYHGYLYLAIQDTSKAEQLLNEASILFEERNSEYPDSLELAVSRIYFLSIYKGKDFALEELEKIETKFPDKKWLESLSSIINSQNINSPPLARACSSLPVHASPSL